MTKISSSDVVKIRAKEPSRTISQTLLVPGSRQRKVVWTRFFIGRP